MTGNRNPTSASECVVFYYLHQDKNKIQKTEKQNKKNNKIPVFGNCRSVLRPRKVNSKLHNHSNSFGMIDLYKTAHQ